MATLNFDANQVEPTNSLEPIPAGKYVAVITDSEMKPTKAGTGQYLQLTFEIIDGEFKGRLLWVRLNLDNPNETAVQIAQAELSAICRAAGVMIAKDSQELHSLPMVISVRLKRRIDTGDMQNEIRGYSATATAPVADSAPASTAPWKR
ncbi:hypothetical protein Q31b_37350 [Novipirellula aureliae]|uniref:DUF669 domain-containing protein n=1 Tax=Novipirellula aureliae TaxID=2527966 RepID=A0A5C6DS06_9BACT|nr:DUF669 domain-containing protein [Novipirellula aureliae]TWU38657.1 hypothetical protein Q31b_37350 [Novipirellula aureliae]